MFADGYSWVELTELARAWVMLAGDVPVHDCCGACTQCCGEVWYTRRLPSLILPRRRIPDMQAEANHGVLVCVCVCRCSASWVACT
jgi:hypothetical protein